MYDLGLINGLAYIDGVFKEINIYISNEKIALTTEERAACHREVDCKGYHLLPGFIDPHVHLDLNLGEFTEVESLPFDPRGEQYNKEHSGYYLEKREGELEIGQVSSTINEILSVDQIMKNLMAEFNQTRKNIDQLNF